MTKKILALMLVLSVVLSMFSLSFSANALVDTSIKYGDIDGNGVVDTNDCMLALKSAAGLKEITNTAQIKRGDVNGDGAITIFDARQILRCSANLVGLQPTGAFTGFKTAENYYSSAEALVQEFNNAVNSIKDDVPGFERQVTSSVITLDIEKAGSFGSAFSGIFDKLEEELAAQNESDKEPVAFNKSDDESEEQNWDNVVSAETQTYVSQLTSDDILGAKSSYDETTGYITIQIALADCEVDNVHQSSYVDVFNPEIIQEKADTVVGNIFSATAAEDGTRKQFKNAVLTAVIDNATGNLVSYTTEYQTDIYISECNYKITKLYGVEYGTKVVTTYNNFQW